MKNSGIEWIGEIPDDWEVIKLKYITNTRNQKYSNEKFQYIGLENIESFSGKYIKTDILPDLSLSNIACDGDVLFGKLRPYLAKAYIVTTDSCVSSEFLVLTPVKVNALYLKYYILSGGFIDAVNASTYGSKMPRANTNFILNLPVLLTSKDNQKKIAEFLDKKCAAVDKLIANQQGQIEKLKEYKQATITQAVTKGLNPSAPMKDSGVEWIGNIPEGWSTNRLKFCSTYNDETLSENEDSNKIIRYVEIGSVTLENGVENYEEYQFKDAPSRARRVTRKDDIIISTVRTYLKAIACIEEDNLIVSTGFCVIRPNGIINSKYIEYFCKSNLFTDNVSANSYGISYPAINASALSAFHIIQPHIEEQQQIAEYLDKKCSEIDKLISIKQAKIEKLNEYKKSLIYEYVTGKKEVV